MMKEYTPAPISTESIILPEELIPLQEQLAKNVHEVWASKRIQEGWQYGESRNDNLKLHPCLVSYEDLPDSEKEYDRATALSTLKLIYKLGFTINHN